MGQFCQFCKLLPHFQRHLWHLVLTFDFSHFCYMFLKNFSCIIKTTRQDWYRHTWNWSSKSHSRTTPEVFLVFHCISSLGIACKSRNISHFRISNRPTERWNLFILCHKEANLIFLEVNFVQLLITICIIFLIETSFLGRKTHLIYILTSKIVSLL